MLLSPNTMTWDILDTQSALYSTCNAGNSANYNSLCQFGNSYQAIPHQSYQLNQFYYSYPKNNKKEVYQVDNEAIKDQPEGFYNIFDANEEDVTYLDKRFDEVIVNFVRIEISYSKCHSSFFSKSKLYKHIKARCIGEVLPSFFILPFSSIFIIAPIAIYQFFSSGLAFKDWTYATTTIILDSHYLLQDSDLESIACLDTGYGVTLVNKN